VTEEWTPEAGFALLRKIRSLPYRALNEVATVAERSSSFIVRVDEIRSTVEERGFWEDVSEWRISTAGSQRLERVGGGFATTTTAHGRFSATFPTFSEAYEAMSVLWHLQTSLFYAVGWSSWPAQKLSRPRDDAERYLQKLAKAARSDVAHAGSITRVPVEWSDTGFAYRVVVERGSLRMTDDAVDQARAAEFAGIYARLQDDLIGMLDWRPL
jgi:hypothetical protein